MILLIFKFYGLLKKQINEIILAIKNKNANVTKNGCNTKKADKTDNSILKPKKKKNNQNKVNNTKKSTFIEIETKNFPPKKGKKKKKIRKKDRIQKTEINVVDVKDKELLKYNDSELNSLIYKKALLYDKRSFTEYYISLLKVNHLLLFSFYCNNRDYNPQIIKIFLFFYFFAIHFTINALFFSDETMHTIYIDKGSFNFIYQLPKIIYSSLISGVLNFGIKYLSLPEKDIIELKNEKNNNNLDNNEAKTLKKIKIKFVLFFIITFLLLSSFTFYITCFCGVYINTQIHLIKDSLISFFLSLIYPLGVNIVPCLLRLYSLHEK